MTLIDRLSKLDGPSPEIDDLIWETLEPKEYAYAHATAKEGGYEDLLCGPAYTAYVDAAIDLAERVLPGWRWRVGDSYANVWIDAKIDSMDFVGSHQVPAIALCIALLRAKEASKL